MDDCIFSPPGKNNEKSSMGFFVPYAHRIGEQSSDSSCGQFARKSWSIQKRKFDDNLIDFYCDRRHQFTMTSDTTTDGTKSAVSMGHRCVLAKLSVGTTWAFYFYEDLTAAAFYRQILQVTAGAFGHKSTLNPATEHIISVHESSDAADSPITSDLKIGAVEDGLQLKEETLPFDAEDDGDVSTIANSSDDQQSCRSTKTSTEAEIIGTKEGPKVSFSTNQGMWYVTMKAKSGEYGQSIFPMEDEARDCDEECTEPVMTFSLECILTIDLQGRSLVLHFDPFAFDKETESRLRESLKGKPRIVAKYGVDPELVATKVMVAYKTECAASKRFQEILGIWNEARKMKLSDEVSHEKVTDAGKENDSVKEIPQEIQASINEMVTDKPNVSMKSIKGRGLAAARKITALQEQDLESYRQNTPKKRKVLCQIVQNYL